MEARLYRLTIALSILAAIGFGIVGGLELDTARRAQENVEHWLILKSECSGKPEASCDRYFYMQQAASEGNRRDKAIDQGRSFIIAAAGIPASLFLMFFVGRWIITGRMRKPRPSSGGA